MLRRRLAASMMACVVFGAPGGGVKVCGRAARIGLWLAPLHRTGIPKAARRKCHLSNLDDASFTRTPCLAMARRGPCTCRLPADDHFGPATEIREYSFFHNPRMTVGVKEDRVVVEMCNHGDASCSDGSSPAPLVVGPRDADWGMFVVLGCSVVLST